MNILITPNYINEQEILSDDWNRLLNNCNITIQKYKEFSENIVHDHDVLLLTGGNDIIGYERKNNASLLRDCIERKLIDLFIQENKPIIGICRGAHLLNLHFNGSLKSTDNHDGRFHQIKNNDNQRNMILSYHRWSIDKLGDNLSATWLSSSDDTIESFEHSILPIYGILWHPERLKWGFIPEKIKELLCLQIY